MAYLHTLKYNASFKVRLTITLVNWDILNKLLKELPCSTSAPATHARTRLTQDAHTPQATYLLQCSIAAQSCSHRTKQLRGLLGVDSTLRTGTWDHALRRAVTRGGHAADELPAALLRRTRAGGKASPGSFPPLPAERRPASRPREASGEPCADKVMRAEGAPSRRGLAGGSRLPGRGAPQRRPLAGVSLPPRRGSLAGGRPRLPPPPRLPWRAASDRNLCGCPQ